MDGSARTPACCAADPGGAGWDCRAVAPPMTMWLPPPVGIWLPSTANFSAVNRCLRASSSSTVLICSSSSQLLAGGKFTSSTPGSGVTLNDRKPRIGSRGIPLHPNRHIQMSACILHRRNQIQIVGEDGRKGKKHVQAGLRGPAHKAMVG